MDSIRSEYGAYLLSPLERIGAATLGDEFLGQTSSQTMSELIDVLYHFSINSNNIENFLDLGCGNGCFTRGLSQYLSCRAIGLDLNADVVDRAKKENLPGRDLIFLQEDFTDLIQSKLEKSSFDMLLAIGSFYWDVDIKKTLTHLQSYLKRDAPLLIFSNFECSPLSSSESINIGNTRFIQLESFLDDLGESGFQASFLDLSERYAKWINSWCMNLEHSRESIELFFGIKKATAIFTRFVEYRSLSEKNKVKRYAICAWNQGVVRS